MARTGRASRAAKQLGVEHTTISRRLAALERELGVPLFYRTTGGYRLTAHGEGVVPRAEAMERAALAVGASAREGSLRAQGRVRVALLDELASHWLAPQLPAFRARHPGIELQVLAGIQPMDLSRGEADIAVRWPRPRQEGLAAVRLGRTTAGLYASRGLLAGKRLRVEDVESLRGLPLLVYTPQFQRLQGAAWLAPVLASAKIALSTNSTHTLLAAARAAAGVAVLPRFVARGYEDLESVSADIATGEMWLVTQVELRKDPIVRATVDFLRSAASGPSGLR